MPCVPLREGGNKRLPHVGVEREGSAVTGPQRRRSAILWPALPRGPEPLASANCRRHSDRFSLSHMVLPGDHPDDCSPPRSGPLSGLRNRVIGLICQQSFCGTGVACRCCLPGMPPGCGVRVDRDVARGDVAARFGDRHPHVRCPVFDLVGRRVDLEAEGPVAEGDEIRKRGPLRRAESSIAIELAQNSPFTVSRIRRAIHPDSACTRTR
jgi:hypothetical protein